MLEAHTPAALAWLAANPCFLLYKTAPGKRPGRVEKLPVSPHTGLVCSATDPGARVHWAVAVEAFCRYKPQGVAGIALALYPELGAWCIDVDGALGTTGWSDLARWLWEALPGCPCEVSQSGTGLHFFGRGRLPEHACKNVPQHLELYTENRFIALTGSFFERGPVQPDQPNIGHIIEQLFPPSLAADFPDWTEAPVPEWRGSIDDAELIRRASASTGAAAAFGAGARFSDLFLGDAQVLARAYPATGDGEFDRSSADLALAMHLAFWTGKDCARIERIMRRSALLRDKWDREDYMRGTILKACAQKKDVCQDREIVPPTAPAVVPTTSPTGAAAEPLAPAVSQTPRGEEQAGSLYVVAAADFDAYFAGCVWVQHAKRILAPGGRLLDREQFNVEYNGPSFAMDAECQKIKDEPWEAFTRSKKWKCPRASFAEFRPQEAPGVITVGGDGDTYANSYWPCAIRSVEGDASPFLRHVEKLVPNPGDRAVLLAYMAAIVQHQGIKFQWAIVLQGCEGNGKTLLSYCVEAAVGRRYSYWPKASRLTKQFNAWMVGKVFASVEDVKVGENQQDILEELKPLITGTMQEVEMKGIDAESANLCFNLLFNCNDKAAIRSSRDARRWCVIYTAQQQAADLARDGMTGDYMPRLYDWLRYEDGFAIVAHFLRTYQIPAELNPAGRCHRAPRTSATADAVAHSLGRIEQEILECVASGSPGFNGGWISSAALDRLLEQRRAGYISRNRRAEILASLGYVRHPGISGGRTYAPTRTDAAKCTLYVESARWDLLALAGAEVAARYDDCNAPRL